MNFEQTKVLDTFFVTNGGRSQNGPLIRSIHFYWISIESIRKRALSEQTYDTLGSFL